MASPADAGRPRNIAVDETGTQVLVTSLGSATEMSQLRPDGSGGWARTAIAVGGKSWGVAFVDADTAVVTHPFEQHLTVLTLDASSGDFFATGTIEGVPAYCTEIIASPVAGRVLVANRGQAPAAGEEWQHAVYEVDLTAGITRTFPTEREPRALALDPDEHRLFVGNVMGALRVDEAHPDDHPSSYASWDADGGSIQVFDVDDASPIVEPIPGMRFRVGSLVRGLAVLDLDPGGPESDYVVYFTHVGDGANSEAPFSDFGGTQIPNIVSTLTFDGSTHAVIDSANYVFGHEPENVPDASTYENAPLPAVLHEKLVIRTAGPTRELWVTNSGSGTVSRAALDAGGGLVTDGTTLDVDEFELSKNGLNIDVEAASSPCLHVIGGIGGDKELNHVDVGRFGELEFTSNPRGIAYDEANDLVWVATQFDNEALALSGTSSSIAIEARVPVAEPEPTVENGERNFFGFGRGFAFREPPQGNHLRVGTLTCGTCHVDGHLDGKVRITKRAGGNFANQQLSSLRKPVAVPSVFDVGSTEWIFFEGLVTIQDNDDACTYCVGARFFGSTQAFTDTVRSPPSPHPVAAAPGAGDPQRGRFWFEAMNCSRCHSGRLDPFTRSNEDNVLTGGPFPASLRTDNRLLHDASQSFVSLQGDHQSLRNMTDVGTLKPNGASFLLKGVNTPSLAGAWDNAPYLHDGRYRELDEVLEHTWVFSSLGQRAAGLILDGFMDNAFDQLPSGTESGLPALRLHPFATHAAGTPSGAQSVASFLDADAYADLKAFLLSLSSATDPCSGDTSDFVSNLRVEQVAGVPTVRFDTPVDVECIVDVTGPDGSVVNLPPSYASVHEVPLAPTLPGLHSISVTVQARTLCGGPYSAGPIAWTNGSVTAFAGLANLMACPQGDGYPLVVLATFDTSAFSGTLPASAITLAVTGGGVAVFEPVTASSDVTEAAPTTALLSYAVGGCSGETPATADVPVYGEVMAQISLMVNGPDQNGDGVVDLIDLSAYAMFDGCAGAPEFSACGDFDFNGCVNGSDDAVMQQHYGHANGN